MLPERSSPSASSAADISMPREAAPRWRDATEARTGASSCGAPGERPAHRRGYVERQKAGKAHPAQNGIGEGPQLGDGVFQHRHPLDPHAEGKALILGWIDPAIEQ